MIFSGKNSPALTTPEQPGKFIFLAATQLKPLQIDADIMMRC
jgi:hypothetical protein